mgnify:FL=1
MLNARHSVRSTLVRFVESQAQAQLRPEVFARFQTVNVFDRLEYEVQLKIAQHLLDREIANQRSRTEIKISYGPKLVSFLAGPGVHPRLGVRPLRGCIERFVRRALRENVLGTQKSEIHLTPIEP